MHVDLTVNSRAEHVAIESSWTLIDLLRDGLHLLGTKEGCGEGVCGSCTVRMDGALVRSCLVLAVRASGSCIETIEGVGEMERGAALQRAFMSSGAIQCGFCTPGMIVVARELLESGDVSESRVRAYLSGNICRCGGYPQIVRAVLAVRDQGHDAI